MERNKEQIARKLAEIALEEAERDPNIWRLCNAYLSQLKGK